MIIAEVAMESCGGQSAASYKAENFVFPLSYSYYYYYLYYY